MLRPNVANLLCSLKRGQHACTRQPGRILPGESRSQEVAPLREGIWADVVVFDPDTLSERVDFDDP